MAQFGNVVFIVWRESMEALLVIGILQAWLSQQGFDARTRGRAYLWAGVTAGLVAAGLLGAGLILFGDRLDDDAQQIFQTVLMLLAAVLIVISCVLAAWGFQGHWLPTLRDIRDELISNWTLLVFALTFLTAILHVLRVPRPAPRGGVPYAQRIAFKSRNGESFVAVDRIDWIETQGNYVALHVGPRAHLVRETLANIQKQLDPACFVRIHRRAIVAVDRISAIRPEGNGDATLRLADGQELRASRSHRQAIRDHWHGRTLATNAGDRLR